MRIEKETVTLYAVTDRNVINDKVYPTLYKAVEAALQGGATCIQLREKDLSFDDFLKEAENIHTLTIKYNVPLIINDNVELAKVCNAEGVHLGQGDMDVKSARRILGEDKIIGVSAHNVEEALAAEQDGADYLGSGSVFLTNTKNDVSLLSFDVLREICKHVSIPVVAIGGITGQNIGFLTATGVSGIAVVSSVFGADDIMSATKKLKEHTADMLLATKRFEELYNGLTPVLSDKKGIVFDMDGTLLDSMPMWRSLDMQYMGKYGITPDMDFHHKVATMTLPEAAVYIRDCYNIPKEPEQIMQDFQDMVYVEYRDHIPLKPLAYELVKVLKWDGYRIAVATANEIELCELALKRTGLASVVDAVVSCTLAGASKEKPDVFFYACDKIGIAPEQCVVFEDSFRAIQTAKNAGFVTIGAYDEVVRDAWASICELTDGQVVFETE